MEFHCAAPEQNHAAVQIFCGETPARGSPCEQVEHGAAQKKHADVPGGIVDARIGERPAGLYAERVQQRSPGGKAEGEQRCAVQMLIQCKDQVIHHGGEGCERQQTAHAAQVKSGKRKTAFPDAGRAAEYQKTGQHKKQLHQISPVDASAVKIDPARICCAAQLLKMMKQDAQCGKDFQQVNGRVAGIAALHFGCLLRKIFSYFIVLRMPLQCSAAVLRIQQTLYSRAVSDIMEPIAAVLTKIRQK